MTMQARYLVRPDDSMIFEYVEEYGVYQIRNGPTDLKGNRPKPYAHFTYENLTENYDFFPISVGEFSFWEEKNKKHYQEMQQELNKKHYG